jgi:hypothetical protein
MIFYISVNLSYCADVYDVFFMFLLIWALCPCQGCDIILCMIKYDQLLDCSSFASLEVPWTPSPPLRCCQRTCTIFSLYGVTDIHFREVGVTILNHVMPHLKTLISTELLNTLLMWQNHLKNVGFVSQDHIGGFSMKWEYTNTSHTSIQYHIWSSS